jgi:Cft2 family RNA processing exonuclease
VAITLVGALKRFVGLSTDTFPSGVCIGSTYWAWDTSVKYICYDGDNWAKADQLTTRNLSAEDGSNIISEDGKKIVDKIT